MSTRHLEGEQRESRVSRLLGIATLGRRKLVKLGTGSGEARQLRGAEVKWLKASVELILCFCPLV